MQLSFRVPGPPIPQPRQRSRVVMARGKAFSQNYTPAKHPVQAYKQAIRDALAEAYPAVRSCAEPMFPRVAIWMRLTFVLARPGRLVWKTRPMPRVWADTTFDVDNAAKAVLDALSGILFTDDRQVCSLQVLKVYAAGGEQALTEIAIREVGTEELATLF